MNHKNGFNPLSRTSAHRRAMSRNMVTSLYRYERITTTKSKALEVRKVAEKLITRAKIDSVHNRRIAGKYIQDSKILDKLFTEIGPRMRERKGGYTRVLKLGFRQGDTADMVILELVDYKLEVKDEDKKSESKTKKNQPKSVAEDKGSKTTKKTVKASETKETTKTTTTKKASAKKTAAKVTETEKAADKEVEK